MKRFFALLTAAFITATILGQFPEKFSYQAVVRNSVGALVINQGVGIKISILQGSAGGSVTYAEMHTVTTNANGLATLEIGAGTPVSGTFAAIDWSSGPYFLKTETDPTGGTSYTITGTSELVSVPYALYAKEAETADYNNLLNKPILFDGAYSNLTGAPSLATVATTGSYNNLIDKPSLFSGVYSDLSGKPALFDGNYNSLANKPSLFDGNYNSLLNLPVLFNGTWSSLTGKPTTIAGYGITDANVYTDALVAAEGASRAAADASTLSSANAYTDASVTVEATIRVTADATILTAANSYTDAETTARIAAVAATLSSSNAYTNDETTARIAADAATLSSANSYTDAETTARIDADAATLSSANSYTDAETAVRATADAALHAYTDAETVARIASDNNKWSLTGNSGNVDGTNFIGTTDNIPFNIKVNNQKAGRIDPTLFNTFLGYQAANLNSTGGPNTAIGYQSLFSNTIAYQNTANGYQALYANIGYSNTAIGHRALYSNGSANDNTAIGNKALYSNYSAQNTATGAQSLFNNANGANNAAFGYNSLFSNISGSNNTAVGVFALASNTGGNNNTALGQGAFSSGAGISNSTAIGYNAQVTANYSLVLGGTGVDAVKVGIGVTAPVATLDVLGNIKIKDGTQGAAKVLTSDANGVATWQAAGGGGWGLTGNASTVDGTNFIGTTDNIPFNIKVNNQKAGRIDASGPVFLGYQAGNSNTHVNNTGLGFQALFTNTTGGGNVAVGRQALYSNLTGSQNVGIGPNAMYSNTIGNWNTALGGGTLLLSTTGSSNTAVGYSSLSNNTTGTGNSASGEQSLIQNTTGSYNTAHGQQSLAGNRTGGLNVAVGTSALRDNVSGSNATAIGTMAMLYTNDTWTPFTNYNVAVGYEALRGSTTSSANTGNKNTALGYQTLWSNTSGGSNIAIGQQSLYSNTTGSNNTSLGYQSGYTSISANANTTGSNNTFIGYNSGPGTSTQLTNATALGYNALVSASNSIVLGGTGADAVKVGIGVTAPSATLDVAGNVKIVDGTQGAGKVLTSNASGVATWQAASGGGTTHAIGDSYGGGIVFYVYDGGQHGLIAATADQSTGIRWDAGSYTFTMAKADGVGAGKANTAIIIANQGNGDGSTYAARICNEYSVTVGGVTYGDWYLPSKFELNLLYLQKAMVGNLAEWGYWSSTEVNNGDAYRQYFPVGNSDPNAKPNIYNVRAIRAF